GPHARPGWCARPAHPGLPHGRRPRRRRRRGPRGADRSRPGRHGSRRAPAHRRRDLRTLPSPSSGRPTARPPHTPRGVTVNEPTTPHDHVLYALDDGVATITLNRPDRRNAMSTPMIEHLGDLLDHADHDPEVRVLVLAGAGRA